MRLSSGAHFVVVVHDALILVLRYAEDLLSQRQVGSKERSERSENYQEEHAVAD